MWNTGYTRFAGCPADLHEIGDGTPEERKARTGWQAQAIGRDSLFIRHFQRLSEELEMAIAITYLERWPGGAPETPCPSSIPAAGSF